MMWTDASRIECEHSSFRVLSQTQTPICVAIQPDQLLIDRAFMHWKSSFTFMPFKSVLLKHHACYRTRFFTKSTIFSCTFEKILKRHLQKHAKSRTRWQLCLKGKHKIFLQFWRSMKCSLLLFSASCVTRKKAQKNLVLLWASAWHVFIWHELSCSVLKLFFYLISQVKLNPNLLFLTP